MSSTCEPAIWPRDTGQRIACFDSCQLIITWISKLYVGNKGAFICSPSPSAYFPPPTPGRAALGLHSPSRRVCTGGRAGGRTHQIFLASWVLPKILTHGAPLQVKGKTNIICIYISFTGKDNSIGLQKGAAYLPEKQI